MHLFSEEDNFDRIDKSNMSLEDVKHVKLPLGVGISMNYRQRETFGINTQTQRYLGIFWVIKLYIGI